jgi:biotin carboxyl carrier protein
MKYKVRIDGHDFNVEVGEINQQPIRVLVDGETVEVWSETVVPGLDPTTPAPPIKNAGSVPVPPISTIPSPVVVKETGQTPSHDVRTGLRAPIPGIIIKIAVKVGTEVEFGQELCVLEAMKMNNMIRAPQSGTITKIHIHEGEHVKHGDILMEFA